MAQGEDEASTRVDWLGLSFFLGRLSWRFHRRMVTRARRQRKHPKTFRDEGTGVTECSLLRERCGLAETGAVARPRTARDGGHLGALGAACLDKAVQHGWYAKLSHPSAIRLRDFHPPHRFRFIGPVQQLLPNGRPVLLQIVAK
jgi:hypothetical protein